MTTGGVPRAPCQKGPKSILYKHGQVIYQNTGICDGMPSTCSSSSLWFSFTQYTSTLCRYIQNLRTLAVIGAEKSVPKNFLERKKQEICRKRCRTCGYLVIQVPICIEKNLFCSIQEIDGLV